MCLVEISFNRVLCKFYYVIIPNTWPLQIIYINTHILYSYLLLYMYFQASNIYCGHVTCNWKYIIILFTTAITIKFEVKMDDDITSKLH